jgi:hypothetical protein
MKPTQRTRCWLTSGVVLPEGFDTADLKNAKALLEELSNSPR